MADEKKTTGLGACGTCGTCGACGKGLDCNGIPAGCSPDIASRVYEMLRIGSPKLAWSAANGVPMIPFSIRVQAEFSSVAQAEVPQAGSTVDDLLQDTVITDIRYQVQSQNTPAGQDSQANFFFEKESGIEATVELTAPGGGYNPVPDFTPIKLIAGELEEPWLLQFGGGGILMDFRASVTPLPYPVTVTFVYKGFTSPWRKLVDITSYEALCRLKAAGYICDAYEQLYCV